eukprot:9626264-Alexandrium_andersonii.AAC.1
MSASLVGSEMCIRDSGQAQQSAPAPSESARADERASGEAGWQGGLAAVSYTHLTLPTICSV